MASLSSSYKRADQSLKFNNLLALWGILIVAGALVLLGFSPGCQAESRPFDLTIIHTNDVHAHDQPFVEFGKLVGGFSRIGHQVRELHRNCKNAIAIDAGDVFQGSALYSLKHGEVEVELLNKIGFDLATLGNHEFDDGPENLSRQLDHARYAVICANLDLDGVPALAALVKPYVIREFDHHKVAFIGAITPDLARGNISLGAVKVKSVKADGRNRL